MFFSMYHGGITPARGPMPVRALIERAHGRASSYVMSGIGPAPFGRWQFWQLRCRIGAMSFAKVTWAAAAGCCAAATAGSSATTQAAIAPAIRFGSIKSSLDSVRLKPDTTVYGVTVTVISSSA